MAEPRRRRARSRGARTAGALAVIAASGLALGACGGHGSATTTTDTGLPAALVAQARPIGLGPRFEPGVTGSVFGACRPRLGRRIGVHVELFAANRVMLIARGIGTEPPRRLFAGRIAGARCYGALVTLDPTGVVYLRPGTHATMGDLFVSWGQPLSRTRLASFTAGAHAEVQVFVDGRRRPGDPRRVPLTPRAEIVLEVGPHVPPHRTYTFPPNS